MEECTKELSNLIWKLISVSPHVVLTIEMKEFEPDYHAVCYASKEGGDREMQRYKIEGYASPVVISNGRVLTKGQVLLSSQ